MKQSERNRLLREFADDIAQSVAPVLGLAIVPKCRRITMNKGHGYHTHFSVPAWAAKGPTDYFIYYVAHEVCHATGIWDHGPKFREHETKVMAHLGYKLEYENNGKGAYPCKIICLATGKILARRDGLKMPTS